MSNFYDEIGVSEQEATVKMGEYTKELVTNMHEWTVMDFVNWLAEGEVSERKLKILTFITLIAMGNFGFKLRR